MSRKVGDVFIIEQQPEDTICSYCGRISETRPYGENGREICYECGMLPENRAMVETNCQRVIASASLCIVGDIDGSNN